MWRMICAAAVVAAAAAAAAATACTQQVDVSLYRGVCGGSGRCRLPATGAARLPAPTKLMQLAI
jgi:hypothetical protein